MSDIEREEFEQAVTDRWSDSYSFTRFGDEDYYDEVLEGMWQGWQASHQALEGEAIGFLQSSGVSQLSGGHPAKLYPIGATPSPFESSTLVYTHTASADKHAHWSQGSPGLADQYRQEAFAAREALGFSCDSLEVSPADIRQAIADKQAASMPEANKAWASSDPSWVLAHLKEETLFDTESIGEMLAFAKAAATSIPAKAANVPEWIKCSDKMPKINSPVVVARISDNDGKPCLDSGVAALQPNNGWVGLGVFYRPKIDAGTIYQNDLSVMDVTHWMPLPDPPKQEQSHE